MKEERQKWMKYMTRPTFTPLFLSSLIQAYEENVREVIGAGLTRHLFVPSEKGMEWYVSRDEFNNLGRRIMEIVQRKTDFASVQRKECIKTCEVLVDVSKSIGGTDLKAKSSQELLELFSRYDEKFKDFAIFLAIPPALDKFLSEEVEKGVKEILRKQGKLNLLKTHFAGLTTLTELTDAMKEELELLEIASRVEQNKGKITPDIDKMVDVHTEKYRWLSVYAFDLDPLTKDFFLKKLSELRDAKGLLKKRRREFDAKKERFEEVLEEIKPSEDLLRLIETLQGYVFLRTYRTNMLRKAFYYIQPLLEEIGRRAKMTRKEVAYLTTRELEVFFMRNVPPDREEIRERMKHFLLFAKPGVYKITSDGAEIDKIIEQELEIKEVEVQVLRGQGIYPGEVRGKVKIVRSIEDADKMKEGDILVTSMTTPDMHSVILKSAAIITDEGGITSHAALISRELQIPCVIGTEIATKALRDEEFVEVNSRDGIVRRVINEKGEG